MKVRELKQCLAHAPDDAEVMIAVKLPYVTVGAVPMVAVKSAVNGFDWEQGKFIVTPAESLTPSDRPFADQMRKMQDQLGWSEYENSGLKAEIKLLKKQLENNV